MWSLSILARRLEAVADSSLMATYQFIVDDLAAYVTLDRGSASASSGKHDHPDVTISMSSRTLATVVGGDVAVEAALTAGDIHVSAANDTAILELLGALRDWPRSASV